MKTNKPCKHITVFEIFLGIMVSYIEMSDQGIFGVSGDVSLRRHKTIWVH